MGAPEERWKARDRIPSRERFIHIPPKGNFGKSSTQKCSGRGYVIVARRVFLYDGLMHQVGHQQPEAPIHRSISWHTISLIYRDVFGMTKIPLFSGLLQIKAGSPLVSQFGYLFLKCTHLPPSTSHHQDFFVLVLGSL